MSFFSRFADSPQVDLASLLPPPDAQDPTLPSLALYVSPTCFYCVQVRRHLERTSFPVELRDVRRNPEHAAELRAGGGKTQVPCLRIERPDGSLYWLYESRDIMRYLDALNDLLRTDRPD